jgi:hypothetical protein
MYFDLFLPPTHKQVVAAILPTNTPAELSRVELNTPLPRLNRITTLLGISSVMTKN